MAPTPKKTGPCPSCGKPISAIRLQWPSAVCDLCARKSRSRPDGWPTHNRGLMEGDAVCPHCVNVQGSCCACGGARRVPLVHLFDLLANVWARPSCICHACRAVGPMPTGEEATAGERRVKAWRPVKRTA